MFDWFWCKIRFCKNRCPGHSLWARSNFFRMMWRKIDGATKPLFRIFKIFKNENISQKILYKKCFWKYFQNFKFVKKNADNVSNTFSTWAHVANFSYVKENGWVICFFHFSVYRLHYTTKLKCMFWHVLTVAQESKWYHWNSELKLHLMDTIFNAFGHS